MSELPPAAGALRTSCAAPPLLLISLLLLAACDRGGSSEATSEKTLSPESKAADDSTPEVIDAEWVASKFQAPPPPTQKDWLRSMSSNDPRHDPLHSALLPKLASLVEGE